MYLYSIISMWEWWSYVCMYICSGLSSVRSPFTLSLFVFPCWQDDPLSDTVQVRPQQVQVFLRPGRVRGRERGGVGVGRGKPQMGKRRGRNRGEWCKKGVPLCCCLWLYVSNTTALKSTFIFALINLFCSLSCKVCLRASTSRSGQQGTSLLMSIFWWTSQGPWEMTSLQSREFHKILVGSLPHTGGISTHWACVTLWWFSVTVYLYSWTSLMRSLWIRDTTLIRTLSAVPTT